MEEKHFEEWIELKGRLHHNARTPKILDGEVWWCSFGENVGVEINFINNVPPNLTEGRMAGIPEYG